MIEFGDILMHRNAWNRCNISVTAAFLKRAIDMNRLSHHGIHSLIAKGKPAFVVNDTNGLAGIGPTPKPEDFYFMQQPVLIAVDSSRIKTIQNFNTKVRSLQVSMAASDAGSPSRSRRSEHASHGMCHMFYTP